ncbi:PIN domain-containing protein [Aurantimonas aggregata]|uniref:Ribonuclease VapC n=1 Tax=Aurantimonas aggregata TaxID=2047720 RepID=A0A6L9MNM2_9HYPH|nr:type II toxin-antitoxin system VapC family toxin [Aurantimonas aggregata]NDV89166.1 PIN domain-containing protein [Aurantimonas aggregata]
MFVDACAIIAVLTEEKEAERCSEAIRTANRPMTSPLVVLETVLALMRPDKLSLSVSQAERLVLDFLDARGIAVRDLPPAREATALSLSALGRYRSGRRGLNLADCLHYACAKYYRVPILATDNEFRVTDLEVVA